MLPIVEELALEWSVLGVGKDLLDNRLVGHVPHFGAHAYLHIIYAGLVESEIRGVKESLSGLPLDLYSSFLKHYNGLNIFFGGVALYGKRSELTRDISAPRQPFDIIEHNTLHRPLWLSRRELIIGSNALDGCFYTILEDGGVKKYSRKSCAMEMKSCDNIEEFLRVEISYCSSFFDQFGQLKAERKTSGLDS